MKILQIISAFYPAFAYGGTVNASYNLSKELVKSGHKVTVFTSDTLDLKTRQKVRYLEHEGINIHYFKNISNHLASNRYGFNPAIIGALKNNIRDFDIVHLHGSRSFENIVAAHYARKYNIPYIIQSHGTSLPFFEKQTLKKLYDFFWGYKILKNASSHIASSKNELDQIQSMGVEKNKITIIPYCLDISEFENLPPKGKFKAKWGIRNDEKVVLYFGRINKIKGIDLLIDAFFDLSKEMDDIKLVIAGPDDGFLDFLLKKVDYLSIQEKVIFTGFIDQLNKLAAYVDAEIYVLPSYHESFGLTVLEAWACGTPVILSEGCLISEYIPNKDIIFERDKNRLKDLIKQILLDAELILKLKNEGEQLIKNQFNWSKVTEKYILIYSDVIKKN